MFFSPCVLPHHAVSVAISPGLTPPMPVCTYTIICTCACVHNGCIFVDQSLRVHTRHADPCSVQEAGKSGGNSPTDKFRIHSYVFCGAQEGVKSRSTVRTCTWADRKSAQMIGPYINAGFKNGMRGQYSNGPPFLKCVKGTTAHGKSMFHGDSLTVLHGEVEPAKDSFFLVQYFIISKLAITLNMPL